MRSRILAVFVAVIIALLAQNVQAQDTAQVLINYPEISDPGGDQPLTLDLYFNIVDGEGRARQGVAPHGATVVLDDGSRYDATLERPDTPFFIILALDASGSMGGTSTRMKTAAINLVNDTPAEARFRVIRFNDQIDDTLMTNFSTDRNAISNAIAEVNPVPNAGTCLYDVAYRSVQLLASAPPGRRAVILFTDGVDQVLSGGRCSQHTAEEVIAAASQPNQRVPIHTIGLSGGQPVDVVGLQALSQSTGGVSLVGDQDQLDALFQSVANSIQGQWLASSPIYPQQGIRTATLIVSLSDNALVQPDAVSFSAPRTVNKPAVNPAAQNSTSEGTTVDIEIDAIQLDTATKSIAARVTVVGEEAVSEYRFDLKDARSNLLVGEYLFDAPLPNPAVIPGGNLANGEYALTVTALASDGHILARSEDERFTVAFPTPPPSPTFTPEPTSAVIKGVSFDPDASLLNLQVEYADIAKVGSVRVELFSKQTNLLVGTYTFAPAPVLNIDAHALSGGNYTVVLVAQEAGGQVLSQDRKEFSITPNTPTPSPTTTQTPVPSATPQVGAVIEGVSFDVDEREIFIRLNLLGADQIGNLRVNLFDNRSGLQVNTFNFAPARELHITAEGITSGEYRLEVTTEDNAGQTLNRPTYTFSIVLPTATPTATFTPTETSTPTETPVVASISIDAAELNSDKTEVLLHIIVTNPQLIADYELAVFDESTGLRAANFEVSPVNDEVHLPLGEISNGRYRIELTGRSSDGTAAAQVSRVIAIDLPTPAPTAEPTPEPPAAPPPSPDRGILLAGLAAAGLVLIVIIILLVRRSRRPLQNESSGFAAGLTGIYDAAAAPPSYTPHEEAPDPNSTSALPIHEEGLTSAIPIMAVPAANIVVRDSRDRAQVGKTIAIDKTPFAIGRADRASGRQSDLAFDNDNNVSRKHAEIGYANDQFFITDVGSNHGTRVDGARIQPYAQTPLVNGSVIVLGETTTLVFETEFDADKTRLKN